MVPVGDGLPALPWVVREVVTVAAPGGVPEGGSGAWAAEDGTGAEGGAGSVAARGRVHAVRRRRSRARPARRHGGDDVRGGPRDRGDDVGASRRHARDDVVAAGAGSRMAGRGVRGGGGGVVIGLAALRRFASRAPRRRRPAW